jgi:hypothetical protein
MQHRFIKDGEGRSLKRFSTAMFDSVQDGLRFYEAACKDESLAQREFIADFNAEHRHDADWTGCKTQHEFAERIQQGWIEGADRLMKLPIKEVEPTSIRRIRYRGEQGDDLDIHRVYRGELDQAWEYRKRGCRSSVGRHITIVCNIAANCSIKASQLFWRGASALRLAETLESAGYSVRIVAGMGTRGIDTKDNVNSGYLFEIKSPEQPVDVANLAAIVCLPGYFRIIGFGMKVWACNTNGLTADRGLGYTTQEYLERAVSEWYPSDYCIVQSGEVLDQKSAESWIDSTIDAIQPQQAAA